MQARVLLGLILATALASGCLSSAPRGEVLSIPVVHLRVDGAEPCNVALVANCDEAEEDPRTPWIFRPIQLRNDDPRLIPSIGLLLERMTRGILIEDFTVSGFTTAIQLKNPACQDCTFEFHQGRIAMASLQSAADDCFAQTSNGIRVDAIPQGLLHITGVRFEAPGGGRVCLDGMYAIHSGGAMAISGGPANFRLENITIHAATATVGNAIYAKAGARDPGAAPTFTAKDIQIHGYQAPIEATGFLYATIENADLACGERPPVLQQPGAQGIGQGDHIGINVLLTDTVHLRGLRVAHCLDHGIRLSANDFTEWLIEDFDIRDAGVGIAARGGRTIRLEESVLSDSRLTITDGVIRENRYTGIVVLGFPREAELARLVLERNGWDAANVPQGLEGIEAHGGIALAGQSARITDSHIEGNTPYGVYSTHGAPWAVTATHNWWGHASGPGFRPSPPGSPTVPTGSGDAVSEAVVFAPWRTTPTLKPGTCATLTDCL